MFDLRNFAGRAPLLGAVILFAGLTAVSGCKKNADATQVADNSGPDPADVNLAPVGANQSVPVAQAPRTRVLGQSQSAQPQQTTESYPQQAPIERAPDPENYTPPQGSQNDQAYQPGDENFDQTVDQYASEPPPPLPVYEQPPCPEPNYLWTPGYWSYASAGYFWVPGAWAAPPYYGALWTPGYWGVDGGRYGFHRGFWGLHIGFYGGIAYGFGYTGSGYHGGYWSGNNFYYNRAVNRVNVTNIHNTYVRNVTINNTVINNRISYNGGRGGIQARPAAYEVAAMRERHTPPMAAQVQLREQSQQNRQQFFNENKGRPAAVVAARPLAADRGIAAPQREGVQRQAVQQGIRPEAQGTRPEAQAGRTAQGGFGNAQPQRNESQQRNESPQRDVQTEQRNQQEQQRNELQQRNAQQQEQQRNLQVQHNQQQQLQQRNDQQRSQQERSQVPTRTEQPRQPRVQEQRQPQPQAQQPRVEPQRAAPQPQPHAQPRPEARPEERPHPEGRPPR